MAGSSGLLGTRLRAQLDSAGHDVVQLVRREPTGTQQSRWWPDQGIVDVEVLRGADAVINLAGSGVQDKRWDDAYKQVLRSSRVEPTRTLARAIAELPAGERPALLNASAVGFYGDRGDEILAEDSLAGEGFLAKLAIAWEAATAAAEDAGARVVKLRTGVVLDASGGLFKPLVRVFRLGIGGKLADGRMWMPLLSMADWLGAVSFLLQRPDITGPVNVVGPSPVRNKELTQTLARLVRRPAIAPVPAIALRVLYGEVADDLLTSHRVVPKVLLEGGFSFQHPELESMLRAALDQA